MPGTWRMASEKCALDRLTADTAHELRPHNVNVVSLWPGLALTERTQAEVIDGLDFTRAESHRFTGRAVKALATDLDRIRWNGQAVSSRELADFYGFKDIDGRLPDGPLRERPGDHGTS